MKKMLKLEMKRHGSLALALSIIFMILSIENICFNFFSFFGNPIEDSYLTFSMNTILLTGFLAFYELQFKMKKVGIDQMYALPIKKEKLYLGKFLAGYGTFAVAFTSSFLAAAIALSCRYVVYSFTYLFFIYLSNLLMGLLFYGLIFFIVYSQNTMVDAIFNVFMFLLLFEFVILAMDKVLSNWFQIRFISKWTLDVLSFFPFGFILLLNQYFSMGLEGVESARMNEWHAHLRDGMISAIFYIIVLALFALAFFYKLKKDKPEKVNQISDSYFSYRVMIPALTISSMLVMDFINAFTYLFFLLLAYLLYVMYQRKLKLNRRSWIMMGVIALMNLLTVINFYTD